MLRLSALALALFTLLGVAHAEPRKVVVGTYLQNVYAIDIKGSQFTVDFYVWFRWKGDDLKPLETFEIPSGRITSRTAVVKKKLKDDENYASARIVATITKFWDLRRYPLDAHQLTIEIEDTESDSTQILYEVDRANTAHSPELQVPGWVVSNSGADIIRQSYHTNYGDTSLVTGNASIYSRYRYSIDVARPGYGRFLKVFFGLFISVVISWCGFFVRPKESSPRVSLGVGATFAAAAVTVAINNSLPDTNAVMMADKLVMLTLGIIVAAVAETITALWLFAREREAMQKRLDKICQFVFPAFYVVMLLSIIL